MFSIETKKAGQQYLSLVPLFMALAFPIFARFRTAKDKALDKRFSINMCLPAVKMLGILIAKQTLQRYKYFF